MSRQADSLSRIHAPEEPSTPEPILPPAILVSPIRWALEEQIRVATLSEPAPPGGLEGKTYFPTPLQSTLWAQFTLPRALDIQAPTRYWWPCMVRDVSLYVRVYSVCAKSKFAGKLVPLPIPHRPWSHVGVDFVIDLPNSEALPVSS